MADIANDNLLSVVKLEAPSLVEESKQKLDGNVKKKRRRGKSKRKITKPYLKVSWQERRKNDKTKRINRFRKVVMAKTHAPFNNNQFLMEIHKPEPENNFQILRTPSARTRDSSFSVDSEENYFYSLPEDEEEYLTKEFSSVYEDAQSERLSNMSKNELIQEYLLLEAKYDNLLKRTERSKPYCPQDDNDIAYTDQETSISDKESMATDRNVSGITLESNISETQTVNEMMLRMKEQEEQINDLQVANEKLRIENEHLRQKNQSSSSEDSESDSSSTSVSCSSSSRSESPVNDSVIDNNTIEQDEMNLNEEVDVPPVVNGFHSPGKSTTHNGI